MPPSIQSKLNSALAPVQAPDELWARVNAALPGHRPHAGAWRGLAMAAALAALMSGGVLYLRAQSASPSFAATAVSLHRHREAETGIYAVQRHTLAGEPVTVVSVETAHASSPSKQIRTVDTAGLAISEWTSHGRRWAMVSAKATHKQACSVCHRA